MNSYIPVKSCKRIILWSLIELKTVVLILDWKQSFDIYWRDKEICKFKIQNHRKNKNQRQNDKQNKGSTCTGTKNVWV